jgi:hypothetical protein
MVDIHTDRLQVGFMRDMSFREGHAWSLVLWAPDLVLRWGTERSALSGALLLLDRIAARILSFSAQAAGWRAQELCDLRTDGTRGQGMSIS